MAPQLPLREWTAPQANSRDKKFERDGDKELGCDAANRMAKSPSLSQV